MSDYSVDIQVGETVKLPAKVLVTGSKERLLSARCVGKLKHGLLFNLSFLPGWGTENPESWNYNLFVNYNAIYCGDIPVIRTSDGSQVRAKRLSEVLL